MDDGRIRKITNLGRNVEGRFYVDSGCSGCNLCVDVAPYNFKNEKGRVYVSKQPESEEELKNCLEAFAMCPVGAIKDLKI